MIKEAIIKLSKKQDLAYAEAEAVMDEIMSGQATPVQMSAYLTALALKGETIDEYKKADKEEAIQYRLPFGRWKSEQVLLLILLHF